MVAPQDTHIATSYEIVDKDLTRVKSLAYRNDTTYLVTSPRPVFASLSPSIGS